jgi:hypothetical protein
VDHGAVVVVRVLNRLMAPRALVRVADWVAQTVLTQTLGVSAEKFNDDRLGRTLDAIASHEREIGLEIVNVALVQFDLDVSFIFYDLTAFVMQGEFKDSDKVDYGFAHNTPSDKQKVKEELSVSHDGNVPLDYDSTSGRTADLATVQANMERLCHLLQRCGYPIDQVVIIGDRGTLNDEIAVKYDEKGLKYLAGLKVHKTVVFKPSWRAGTLYWTLLDKQTVFGWISHPFISVYGGQFLSRPIYGGQNTHWTLHEHSASQKCLVNCGLAQAKSRLFEHYPQDGACGASQVGAGGTVRQPPVDG